MLAECRLVYENRNQLGDFMVSPRAEEFGLRSSEEYEQDALQNLDAYARLARDGKRLRQAERQELLLVALTSGVMATYAFLREQAGDSLG